MRRSSAVSLVVLASHVACSSSATLGPGPAGSTAPTPAPVASAPPAPIEAEPLGPAEDSGGRPRASESAKPKDAYPEEGGLGLSGIGEGGAGKGSRWGADLSDIGTIGHGAGAGFGSGWSRSSARSGRTGVVRGGSISLGGQHGPGVQAGEWDDNANFREFQRWLSVEPAPGVARLDLSVRRFLVVRDSAGKPVSSCKVTITDPTAVAKPLELVTTSTGRALFFPRAEGYTGAGLEATARCEGAVASEVFDLTPGDAVVSLSLETPRSERPHPTLDVAFVVDTTGSMGEEIAALRGALREVASGLAKVGVTPRVGLVEYRDVADEYVTRLHPMTTDVAGLAARIDLIKADGGGDTPEHVNEAVRVAVQKLRFKEESLARLVFLVGDAPPHLDYRGDSGYDSALRDANHRGIQLYTVAASGMDTLGQVVFRQLSQYTGATSLFVLRGGAGPASVGGGDPRTSCGDTRDDYTSGNLATLVLDRVRAAVAAHDADPLVIPGLHKDERARSCPTQVTTSP